MHFTLFTCCSLSKAVTGCAVCALSEFLVLGYALCLVSVVSLPPGFTICPVDGSHTFAIDTIMLLEPLFMILMKLSSALSCLHHICLPSALPFLFFSDL